jgi:pimeloyl-ACP methyl ester carboxylesterase
MSDLVFHHLDVRDERIEMAWFGPANSPWPALVFLHEGLGCAEMWRDFPLELAETTQSRALVYSRAGYGGSSPVAVGPRSIRYLYDEAEERLPALLDVLGIQRCILIGHSDGASIALIHAATRNASGRVNALILEAPHAFVEDISVTSIERIKIAFETTDLREKLQRRHGNNVDCAFWGWNGMWLDPAFRSFNIEHLLPAISIPVLAIQGVDDEYGTLRQIDALQSQCSGPVKRLVLDACGHSPHRDQREKTLHAMRDAILRWRSPPLAP